MILKKGVKFAPPVNREITSKDVKYAFERSFTKNVGGQYTTYFNFDRGRPGEAGRAEGDLRASATPRTTTRSCSSSPTRRRRRLRRVAGHADHRAGPEGVRGEVRQEEPVDVQQERRRHRPVHGRQRRPGQAHGLQGRQVDRARPQPELGRKATRLPSGVPRRDPAPHERDRRQRRRRGRCSQGQNLVLDTNPPAQVLKQVVQRSKDQFVTRPVGWLPLLPDEHDGQAVRRHQRPQGGPRRLRPRRGPQGARRQVRRRDRDALPPAGVPGLRGGRWRARARATTSSTNDEGRPGRRRRST